MSARSLDQLLEHARAPEPDDDGFTENVMQRIRMPRTVRPFRSRFRGRFVARPAVLAAAAVLATGGALAAAVTTTTRVMNNAAPTTTQAQLKSTPSAVATTQVSGKTTGPAPSARSVPTAHATATPKAVRSFRNATLEWGYTSVHTSYVLDKATGLRFVIDTRSVSVKARRAHDVTVTLINTSSKPVGISSQNGCAISVAAWRGSAGDGSVAPGTVRNPAKAQMWTCADGTNARAGSGEEFLLGPGGVRAETVRVTLGSGDWATAAVCRCDVVTAVNPGNGMTLHGLDGVVAQSPTGGSTLVTTLVGVKSV